MSSDPRSARELARGRLDLDALDFRDSFASLSRCQSLQARRHSFAQVHALR
jgi:hypothetical protein